MRTTCRTSLAVLLLAAWVAAPLRGDYLKNSDLKEGIQCWHGDGTVAFLKADGTEGSEGDPGVTPVIKVALTQGHVRTVSQEFSVRDNPANFRFKVQIMASRDYKRRANLQGYTVEEGAPISYVQKYDFWFRFTPFPFGDASMAKIGEWTTLQEDFKLVRHDTDWAIHFTVPPGDGAIYIKNPSIEPSP